MAVPLRVTQRTWQLDPEQKLRRLRRRFARVTRRIERADRVRRLRRATARALPPLLVVSLIAIAGFAALIWTSPWP